MTASESGVATENAVEQEEKTAIPLELFFDLVFVFAITQVVSLIVDDLTIRGIFRGALVLALLWWAWGVWAWTTNSSDLEPRLYRAVILVSMVGVFVMAHAVPFAFEGQGRWVAIGYVFVRGLAALLGFAASTGDPVARKAFWTYTPISSIGPAVVLAGAFMGDAQQWWWLAGFGLELAAAGVAGQADWQVDAGHFAERHGLILIIALGEAIIAVGATLTGEEPSLDLALLLGVGLAGACALWWAYFDRLQEGWEHALRSADLHHTGRIARDIYSILHYPMIVGIVFYAVALEQAFHHPDDPLDPIVANLLIAAVGLYLLAMVAATLRAFGTLLYERLVFVVVLAAVARGWSDGSARNIVLVSTLLLLVTMTVEYIRFRRRHWVEPRPDRNANASVGS